MSAQAETGRSARGEPFTVRTAWARNLAAPARDYLSTETGGAVVLLFRPEVAWLGCAALPEACVAAISPAAAYYEEELQSAQAREARIVGVAKADLAKALRVIFMPTSLLRVSVRPAVP